MHSPTDSLNHDFYRDGYAFLGPVFRAGELDAMRDEEARFRPVPRRKLVDEPNALTIFRSQVCAWSPTVRNFAMTGLHLDAMQSLLGPDIALYFNQFVTKLPDGDAVRGEFPWHQDLGYRAIEPMLKTVTVWVALDDVDEVNGCVWVMPGSHQNGLLSHRTRSTESWHLEVPVSGSGVPAKLRAGEAVAFTGLTLHRSLHNRSLAARRGFFIAYVPADSYYPDSRTFVIEGADSWMVRGAQALNATVPDAAS